MVRICLVFFAAMSLGLSSTSATSTEMAPSTMILHAGRLIAVPGEPAATEQSIVVREGKIEAIKSGYITPQDAGAKDATVIDLTKSTVLPGLIDAHVHLSIGGWPTANLFKLDEAGFALVILENARKTLSAGFTTVRDLGSLSNAIFVVRDAINAGRFDGPRILAAGRLMSVTGGHGDMAGYPEDILQLFHSSGICDGPYECRKAVRTQIRDGADVIKIATSRGGDDPRGAAAPTEMMPDEIAAIVAIAHAAGLKVAAHAHATAAIDAALTGGVDSVEHGGFLDKGSIALFKKTGAFLVPTMVVLNKIQEGYDKSSPKDKAIARAFLDNMPNNIAAAYRAGIPIALGTDAGVTPHGKNALEFMWYHRIGMTNADALRTATVNGAKLLGLDKEIGTIAVGKRADIIATDANPLEDVEALQSVAFVMSNGKVFKAHP